MAGVRARPVSAVTVGVRPRVFDPLSSPPPSVVRLSERCCRSSTTVEYRVLDPRTPPCVTMDRASAAGRRALPFPQRRRGGLSTRGPALCDGDRSRPGRHGQGRESEMEEGVGHYCGIFGISGDPHGRQLTALGCTRCAAPGRGEHRDRGGDGRRVTVHTGMGHVADVFRSAAVLERLSGTSPSGTTGTRRPGLTACQQPQPSWPNARRLRGVAHNGNMVNTAQLRRWMQSERRESSRTTTDSELILHLIAVQGPPAHRPGIERR